MAWYYLFFAGILEIIWAYSMKQSLGFSRLFPSLVTLISMSASFWLLAAALRTIPLGTAYMIWTGIGAVGTFLIGMILMDEPANLMRLAAAGLIVSGLVLMKVASP